MKKLIIILLLLVTTSIYAQQRWEKATFREAPRIGETVAVSGAIVMGYSLYSSFDKVTPISIGTFVVGGIIAGIGIKIDINSGETKYKYKRKIKWNLSASGSGIKATLTF